MQRILTSTAIVLALGTTVHADEHGGAFSEMTFDESVNLNASELIGMSLYATEEDMQKNAEVQADGEKNWDDIGEINEIVLTRDGEVQSVIAGVGGFVGIGEKDVAVDMSKLRFVSDGEQPDEFFVVVKASAVDVENAPSYGDTRKDTDMSESESMSESNDKDMAAKSENKSDEQDMAAKSGENRQLMSAPEVELDGYMSVQNDDLTAEEMTGTSVYGENDEHVGEVSELVLTDNGKIDRAVIDVGGFLGMGEHSVAVTLDELEIMRADEGGDLRVYIDASEKALKDQPEYRG